MLLIWMVMLVAGLWAVFSGKLPMVLFSGLGTHQVTGLAARAIGACLALSAPISFVCLIILNLLLENNNIIYTLVCGLSPTLLVMVGAVLAVPRVRTLYPLSSDPVQPLSPEAMQADATARQKIQRSMYVLALGLGLSFVVHAALGIIVFPLAFLQATQAMATPMETGLKNRYRDEANMLCLLSVALVVCALLITSGVIT